MRTIDEIDSLKSRTRKSPSFLTYGAESSTPRGRGVPPHFVILQLYFNVMWAR